MHVLMRGPSLFYSVQSLKNFEQYTIWRALQSRTIVCNNLDFKTNMILLQYQRKMIDRIKYKKNPYSEHFSSRDLARKYVLSARNLKNMIR